MSALLPPQLPAPSSAAVSGRPKEPFSHQAAKFSAYAPFILLVLGACLNGQMRAHAGTDTGVQLAFAIGSLFLLTTTAAFVLGWFGLHGGIVRRAVWTIVLAAAGIFLNGGLLAMWGSVIWTLVTRPAAQQAAAPENWTTVTLEPLAVRLDFPGDAKKEVKAIESAPELTMTQYTAHDAVATYMVMVTPWTARVAAPSDEQEVAKILDGALDSGTQRLGGQTRERRSLPWGATTGREHEIEFDTRRNGRDGNPIVGLALARAFLKDDSIVTLIVILSRSDHDQDTHGAAAKRTRFFDSLKLE